MPRRVASMTVYVYGEYKDEGATDEHIARVDEVSKYVDEALARAGAAGIDVDSDGDWDWEVVDEDE